jgi:4a-hydroxytetrahydrobiopterin dehydratase
MSELLNKKCVPCQGGVPPLSGEQLQDLHKELEQGWRLVNDHHLEKDYAFANYAQALAFTNQIAALAESEGHHPDLWLTVRRVRLTYFTHAIDGLVESDFIMAAKSDQIYANDFSSP